MKVIGTLLLLTTLVICEVPPPYPTTNFRPHPLLLPVPSRLLNSYGPPKPPSIRYPPPTPQRQYGAPNNVEFLDIRFRPSFSNSFNGKQTAQNNYRPPSTYGPPNENFPQKQPQTTYGLPQQRPAQNGFNSHQNGNVFGQNNLQQNIPQNSYNAPSNYIQNNQKQISSLPPTTYGAPRPRPNPENFNQQQTFQKPNIPQNTYIPPQTTYGTPENNNVEFLERLRNLIAGFDKGQLTTQYLPVKEANNFQKTSVLNSHSFNFRNNLNAPQHQSTATPSEQYLPVKEAGDFGRGFEWTQSTPHSRNVPLPNITHLPGNNLDFPRGPGKSLFPDLSSNVQQSDNNVEIQQVDVRTLYPPLGNNDNNNGQKQFDVQKNIQDNSLSAQSNLDNGNYLPPTTTRATTVLTEPVATSPRPVTTLRPSTEPPYEQSTEPDVNAGPNVAVATAVAGQPPDQQFYLVQPDGRLQRVVYQKSKQEGDTDNEYVADYYFQNIQANPNVVYTPLITLG